MEFAKVIREGMELIIKGCKMNDCWDDCWDCPFKELCTMIQTNKINKKTPYSTPDCWEEQGIWSHN